jgi:hypothetical protein
MTDKNVYLLNFSGPNFLASFATLFQELREKEIETLDFQYQAYMGFGSGMLYLKAPAERRADIIRYAEALDWKSSFVSSDLPAFYQEQNERPQSGVRFLLLDDEYEDVLATLEAVYEAAEVEGPRASDHSMRLKSGQVWHFTCAREPGEAVRRLTEDERARCDILLLDMKLRGEAGSALDGMRFFDELRRADRLLPTIVITQEVPARSGGVAEWEKNVVQQYWRAGAWSFLYKSELKPRLAEMVDLLVDRRTEPLVVVVTSKRLSADLAFLFGFLRNKPVKIVRASCAPAGADGTRLVLECVKHESVPVTDLQQRFKEELEWVNEALRGTSAEQTLRERLSGWVRFHHGRIYEAMSFR